LHWWVLGCRHFCGWLSLITHTGFKFYIRRDICSLAD
jgi:hypothetical protein